MPVENIGMTINANTNLKPAEEKVTAFLNEYVQKGLNIPVKVDKGTLEESIQIVNAAFKQLEDEANNIQLGKGDVIGVGFNEIKHTAKEVGDGIIRVTETFSDGMSESRTRVLDFKQEADGTFSLVSSDITKMIKNLSDYNQELDLTAKKLKIVDRYSETKRLDNGMLQTQIYTKNGAGQEMLTTITLEEKLGETIKRTRQEIVNEKGEWEEYSGEIVEIVSNQEKLRNSLLKTKNVLEQTDVTKGKMFDKESGQYVDYKLTTKTIQDSSGNQIRTEIKEWQDKLGKTIQETTTKIKNQKGEWETIGNVSRKVLNDQVAQEQRLQKVITDKTTTNNSYKKIIDGTTHEIETQTVVTKNLANETVKTSQTTDKFTDSQGRLVTTITKVNEEGQRTTETLIQMGDKTKHLGQSFTDVIAKVAKFYLASLPIRAVQKAITSTVESIKDFDSSLTEFKKVSDLSGKSLDEYCEKLEKLGELTARTRTEMVQMATEFKRSGFSDEDSAKLAQTASLYQNIADEELSASDASAVLISQMKAFKFEAKDAEHVIDSINEVANRNAVSSGDIGRGLTQAGAALSTYGNTFEQTIGLVTAGTEIDYWKVS